MVNNVAACYYGKLWPREGSWWPCGGMGPTGSMRWWASGGTWRRLCLCVVCVFPLRCVVFGVICVCFVVLCSAEYTRTHTRIYLYVYTCMCKRTCVRVYASVHAIACVFVSLCLWYSVALCEFG